MNDWALMMMVGVVQMKANLSQDFRVALFGPEEIPSRTPTNVSDPADDLGIFFVIRLGWVKKAARGAWHPFDPLRGVKLVGYTYDNLQGYRTRLLKASDTEVSDYVKWALVQIGKVHGSAAHDEVHTLVTSALLSSGEPFELKGDKLVPTPWHKRNREEINIAAGVLVAIFTGLSLISKCQSPKATEVPNVPKQNQTQEKMATRT